MSHLGFSFAVGAWQRGSSSSGRKMFPLHRIVACILIAAAFACARHTGATDGEIVTIDRSCGDAGCDGWAAHPQLTETPGVLDACVSATQRFDARCGVALDAAETAKLARDCKQLAQTHGEGAFAWLACRGGASCEAPAAGCEQTSTFGDELCTMPTMSCSSYCTDRFRRFLDEIAPRLKPALLAAARTCGTQKLCGDATSCMSAWLTLIE
jgi:hypothetical protein